MKWIVCFLLTCSAVFGWDFQDYTVGEYTFQWDREEDFDRASEMFVKSFMVAYQDFSAEQLGVESVEGFLKEVIDDERQLKKEQEDNIHWLIMKKDEEVIGLLILEMNEYPQVYGRQMAIAPEHMRTGIGRTAADVVLENLPGVERFVAITRVVNQVSSLFFESLGFKRVEYMHEGYDPNKYVGYEYYPHQ